MNNNLNNNYVNILCCNIRSVNSNFDELILFLENEIDSKKLDIIVLTETWHEASIHCNYNINGYNLFYSSINRNQSDGIFIFVKDILNVEFYEYDFVETNFVKLTLMNLCIPIHILFVYRSPSTEISNFISILRKVLDDYKYKGGYTTLIGDMNINILGNNSINNEYLDLLSEYGFASFININTRVPIGRNHSCIDHIFTKSNDHLISTVNAGVLQTDITDHFSTGCSIPINNVYKTKNNIFPAIDHDKINRFLDKEKWSEIFNKTSVNECCNAFKKIINTAIDKSTSYTVITSKNKRLKEWMSAGLLCSTHHK